MEQTIGKGLLQNLMNFDPGWEQELNNWLNYEHIVELLHAPGIPSARRFVLVNDAAWGDVAVEGKYKWMTHYQLEDEDTMQSEGYLHHRKHGGTVWTNRILNRYRLERTVYGQIYPESGYLTKASASSAGDSEFTKQPIGSAVLHYAMNVEPEWELELNDWLDTEFLPAILALPAFISARRFRKKPVPDTDLPGYANDRRNEGNNKYVTVIELADESALQSAAYLEMRGSPSAKAQELEPHYQLTRSVYRQIYPSEGACEDRSGIKPEAFVGADDWVAPLKGGI